VALVMTELRYEDVPINEMDEWLEAFVRKVLGTAPHALDEETQRPIGYNGPCSKCGAVAWGRWPHDEGRPCPIALDEHKQEQRRRDEANVAYIEMLNAQRESFQTSQLPMLDFSQLARKMYQDLGGEEPDS
jgi:hypothetical protein